MPISNIKFNRQANITFNTNQFINRYKHVINKQEV